MIGSSVDRTVGQIYLKWKMYLTDATNYIKCKIKEPINQFGVGIVLQKGL